MTRGIAVLSSLSFLLSEVAAQNYWFSFGDSYTQTGFDYTSTLPSSGNPLGNPVYPGYTSSNGENWVDYLTTTYNNSEVFTYNYAYGGATIDSDLVTPYDPSVISLTQQVQDQFLPTQESIAGWSSENALFSVWIGINDIGNSYYLEGDRDEFSDTLLDAYFALIDQLYAVGARNFLFINVPPVDRSPLMLAQSESAQEIEAEVIVNFNSKLAQRAADLEATDSEISTFVWDSWTAFSAILDDPTSYGFRDAVTYGTDEDLFWLNDLHPGFVAHELFAQGIAEVLEGTVW